MADVFIYAVNNKEVANNGTFLRIGLLVFISAMLGLSAVLLNEVSGGIAIAIVVAVILVVFFGARKLGILRMKNP